MFGCLRKIGCLGLIVALGVGYYLYRDGQVPSLRPSRAAEGGWVTIDSSDGRVGQGAVEKIKGRSGRAYTSLTAEQAVAYLIYESGGYFNASYGNISARINGDTLQLKSLLSLRDLGVAEMLGPLAGMLSAQDTVQLSGTVGIISPGLGQFRVSEARIRGMAIPSGLIPRLIAQIREYEPDGLAPNGLPLPLPPYVEDIRIANGKITLYRKVD